MHRMCKNKRLYLTNDSPIFPSAIRRIAALSGASIGFTVFGITPAYAYLDPGTGSIVLQLLFGGVAGALVIFKLYWHRIKMVFKRQSTDIDLEEKVDAPGKQHNSNDVG